MDRARAAGLIFAAAIASQSDAAATPIRADGVVDDLIIALHLGSAVLDDEMTVISVDDRVYAPFDSFARAFDFAVEWSPSQRRAEGWFISEARRFSLDLQTGRVVADGRASAIEEGAVIVRDGALYVRLETLAAWFPLDLTFDRSELSIRAAPRERLPIEDRRLRAERRETVRARRAAVSDSAWPRVNASAALAPSGLASFQTALHGRAGVEAGGDLVLYADVRGATLATQIDVAHGRRLNVRGSAARTDPDGRALGGLIPATRWVVGEVAAAEAPAVWRGAFGRGVTITNAPLDRSLEFDRISLQGDAPKGYDVELYRNGLLIDAASDSGAGRYEFADAPLTLGANDLEVVMYGPQGQVRTHRQTIVIGPGALQKGGLDYSVSIAAPRVGSAVDRESWRAGARVTYGLSSRTTIVGTAAASSLGGEGAGAFGGGLRQSVGPLYLMMDLSASSSGESAGVLALKTAWRGGAFDVSVRDYGRSAKVNSRMAEAGVLRAAEASSNFVVAAGHFEAPVSVSARWRTSIADEVETALSARSSLRTGFGALNLSVGVNQTRGPIGPPRQTTLVGLDVQKRVLGLDVRGRMECARTCDAASASVDARVRGDDLLRFSLGRQERAPVLGVSWLRQMNGGEWIVSALQEPRGASLSIGARVGFIGPAFGGGARPARADFAQSGQVFARVFEDRNGDGRFDGADAPVAGVRVRGASGEAVTDARGVARFPSIPNDRRTAIELDVGSLPDPWLAPQSEGYSIVARPGAALMTSFPLRATGDVSGAALAVEGDARRPIEGMRVSVIDPATGRTRSALTEFDGVWYLERVEPGTYRVCADATMAARAGYAPACVDAIVSASGRTARAPPILLAPATTTQAGLAPIPAGGR